MSRLLVTADEDLIGRLSGSELALPLARLDIASPDIDDLAGRFVEAVEDRIEELGFPRRIRRERDSTAWRLPASQTFQAFS